MREQVSSRMFDPGESSVVMELTQAMHASMKAFMKIDFASCLLLVDFDLGGLRQLCSDLDAEDVRQKQDSSKVVASSDSFGK